MVDPITLIVSALVSGILAGVEASAQQAVYDGYRVLRSAILRKYATSTRPRLTDAIVELENDPRSTPRQAAVAQELRNAGAEHDDQLLRLATELTNVIEDPMSRITPPPPDEPNLVEQARRQAGLIAIGQTMNRHIDYVLGVRSRHTLEDTDLLTTNIARRSNLPQGVRDEISSLHHDIHDIVAKIASHIEEAKYKDAEQAIQNMPLAYTERQRAASIVAADKRVHISYHALRVTVEFFSELNKDVLDKIEREASPHREFNMVLGNAIMIFELTEFVIRYIDGFTVAGRDDIDQLYRETQQKISDLRNQQEALKRRATAEDIEEVIRDQTLEYIRNRESAISLLEQEWQSYLKELDHLYLMVGGIRDKLPTLELIRDNAQVQIGVLQLVAMLRFLKQNSEAMKGTIDALKGFRLAPLSPTRVRRLLGI